MPYPVQSPNEYTPGAAVKTALILWGISGETAGNFGKFLDKIG